MKNFIAKFANILFILGMIASYLLFPVLVTNLTIGFATVVIIGVALAIFLGVFGILVAGLLNGILK